MPLLASQSFQRRYSNTPQPTPGTGQEKDKETADASDATGEMHYGARAYSPRQMRFVQNDPPVWNLPELHYSYVKNRPISVGRAALNQAA